MDVKALLRFVLDPKILAIAGGYLSYRYIGREKEGVQPYLYGAGGVVAGYAIGRVAQQYLTPPVPVQQQLQAQPQVQLPVAVTDEDIMNLDTDPTPVTQRLALPPAQPPQVETPTGTNGVGNIDTRAEEQSDWNLLNNMGSFAGSGEEGLGSYGTGIDESSIEEVEDEVQQQRRKRRRRAKA